MRLRSLLLVPALLAACATSSPAPSPAAADAQTAPAASPAALPPLDCGAPPPDTLATLQSPRPGAGLRALDQLVAATGSTPQVAWTTEMDARRIDWLVADGPNDARLWLVRQVPGGVCVLGSWSPGFSSRGPLLLAGRARTDGAAVALVRFEPGVDGPGAPITHWSVLATDGRRLWHALQGPGGTQLVAREARLRPESPALYLDVPTPSGATAVLKFDGQRFVKLN